MLRIINLLAGVYTKQNAVITILCRNSDEDGIAKTLENFEERFNSKYNYPYVFLNDKEFTDEFKERLNKVTRNNAKYGKVKSVDWDMPNTIDISRAEKYWKEMMTKNIPYADRISYHNMCRYFSKGFYKHPLLLEYDYYWRIEPNVIFHCDIDFDPFDEMETNGYKYSFVITIYEFMETIKTLMKTTAEFLIKNDIEQKDNLRFMFEKGRYNGCHFWSNFEIASFEFLRSKIYNDYVDYLDNSGGFYYERWGDAPVHSIAAALFLNKSEIHFFDKIGYTHDVFMHCPSKGKKCNCDVSKSVDFAYGSCLPAYLKDKEEIL